ncbi:hypothetical protein QHH11_28950, partial [Aphanizomenon sp. PH219]|nr:hypothetical protein [Aphanizomenon sp. 202]MDK2463088.1 hypothetical protein [Aphanizomenon sp. PH219]
KARGKSEEGLGDFTFLYTPPSAPPGVTIGNFGFLNTLEDNFYTKFGKFQIAIANPKSPNDQFSLCDS